MLNGPKSSTNRAMQEAIASVLVAGLVVGTGAGMYNFLFVLHIYVPNTWTTTSTSILGSFLSYPLVKSL